MAVGDTAQYGSGLCRTLGTYNSSVVCSQVMSALASVLMAWTHAAFYIPTGVFGILFFAALSAPTQYAHVLPLYRDLYLCSMCISSAANLPDLFVYLFIFPGFRKRARKIFACRGCQCIHRSAQSGHSDSRGTVGST